MGGANTSACPTDAAVRIVPRHGASMRALSLVDRECSGYQRIWRLIGHHHPAIPLERLDERVHCRRTRRA